jgi:hypothetical protein
MAPALHTASDTARIAFAPSFVNSKQHQRNQYEQCKMLIRFRNISINPMIYLLFTPAPFVRGSVKLLNHEVVNVNLLSGVLKHNSPVR